MKGQSSEQKQNIMGKMLPEMMDHSFSAMSAE
jgi:hypothetical protein